MRCRSKAARAESSSSVGVSGTLCPASTEPAGSPEAIPRKRPADDSMKDSVGRTHAENATIVSERRISDRCGDYLL